MTREWCSVTRRRLLAGPAGVGSLCRAPGTGGLGRQEVQAIVAAGRQPVPSLGPSHGVMAAERAPRCARGPHDPSGGPEARRWLIHRQWTTSAAHAHKANALPCCLLTQPKPHTTMTHTPSILGPAERRNVASGVNPTFQGPCRRARRLYTDQNPARTGQSPTATLEIRVRKRQRPDWR